VYNVYILQVLWSGVITSHSTSPFVENVYLKIKDALTQYEMVINRWPQYSLVLENVRFLYVKTSIKIPSSELPSTPLTNSPSHQKEKRKEIKSKIK